MELTQYAQSLIDGGCDDRYVRSWAYDAQRMVAWHTLCLVPFQSDLRDDLRHDYLNLVSEVLSFIDPREPIMVPVSVREALLNSSDGRLIELVHERTTVHTAA